MPVQKILKLIQGTTYIVSQVQCRNMNILFAPVFFCLWLVIGTSVFFPVIVDRICKQKYLSLYPWAINYIFAIIFYFSLSCETTLLMLACDDIESVKFIIASWASILLAYSSITGASHSDYLVLYISELWWREC